MKKLILLLLFIPLVFSCSSSDELQQSVSFINKLTFNEKNLRCKDNYSLLGTGFLVNSFVAGRDEAGEVLLKRGWDWKKKISYNRSSKSMPLSYGNVKFNNQEYINVMDRIMFDMEFQRLHCLLNDERKDENPKLYIQKYHQGFVELLSFIRLNESYFDTELVSELKERIEMRTTVPLIIF